MLGPPELDAAVQVGYDKGRADGKNPLPLPAGHAALDAAQDAIGFCPLPVHVQPLIYNPKFLLHRAALNTLIPHLVFILGVPQTWNLALGLIEPNVFSMDSCLELAQVPLGVIMNHLVV